MHLASVGYIISMANDSTTSNSYEFRQDLSNSPVIIGSTVGGVILAVVVAIGFYIFVRKRRRLSYESVQGVTRSAPNTRSSSPRPERHLQNRSKSTCLALDGWKDYEKDPPDICTSSRYINRIYRFYLHV